LVEEVDEPRVSALVTAAGEAPRPITELLSGAGDPHPTGVAELDRVLGGGLVPGSVTLLGGEPGIGKSTLLIDVAARSARAGRRALYLTAEESAQQVRRRAERIAALHPDLLLSAETSLPNVLAAITQSGAQLVVIDSIQTIFDPELSSAPGSVAQVRECAYRLVRLAKEHNVAVLLVGHVTKDGNLAGPRVLEHVVDTVLSFEGERHQALRLVRALKHRFGSTHELGLFEMSDGGLLGVPDASGLFLADRRPGLPGSVVFPSLEGSRPLLVEVQALVSDSPLQMPRRSAQGIDTGRLAMLLAVLEQRAGVSVSRHDVYTSAVGGVRLNEPAADVAVALAVASATVGTAVSAGLVACGEIGLGGELRQVAGIERRLVEAVRLGFTAAVVPAAFSGAVRGLELVRAGTIGEAVSAVITAERPPARRPADRPDAIDLREVDDPFAAF
jgi:DNA repair protein RadA/Sms